MHCGSYKSEGIILRHFKAYCGAAAIHELNLVDCGSCIAAGTFKFVAAAIHEVQLVDCGSVEAFKHRNKSPFIRSPDIPDLWTTFVSPGRAMTGLTGSLCHFDHLKN